jgi:hypothetical protein
MMLLKLGKICGIAKYIHRETILKAMTAKIE